MRRDDRICVVITTICSCASVRPTVRLSLHQRFGFEKKNCFTLRKFVCHCNKSCAPHWGKLSVCGTNQKRQCKALCWQPITTYNSTDKHEKPWQLFCIQAGMLGSHFSVWCWTPLLFQCLSKSTPQPPPKCRIIAKVSPNTLASHLCCDKCILQCNQWLKLVFVVLHLVFWALQFLVLVLFDSQ